jgi:uncharacterized protein (UPF0335 family)
MSSSSTMASNNTNACARRITEKFHACNDIMSDIQDLRGQISSSSGPDKQNLETMLQIRIQDKSDEARAGINSQFELLNSVIAS